MENALKQNPGTRERIIDIAEDLLFRHGYSGTSLATPHVVGLAGLLLSQEPGLSNADIRTRIENTVEDLAPVGTDAYYGAGRINAYRAVTGDDTPTTPPSMSTTGAPTMRGPTGASVESTLG